MKKSFIYINLFTAIAFGNDTSKVVQTHNNGKVSIISYYQDTENGLDLFKQETFHFSGPRSMVGTFKNGFRNGQWTFWHENGNKRLEGIYSDGFKDSLWTRWYENGIIANKYFYDNTTIDGKVIEWHIDKECWDKIGNDCECGKSWWDGCENHQ